MIRTHRITRNAMHAHCTECLTSMIGTGPDVLAFVVTHRCQPADLLALGKPVEAIIAQAAQDYRKASAA